ncbi:MAG: beta-ketoacyl-[acyl-carrier-protein] synthase family protein [Ruminococcus sp.]|nr:beta-ketoacyl-[acyl-carrier-protein] synthase family protein [Ruminococcus sp.]CDE33401.1 3-oxoacyl-(Acyl-carrier-protein) synthase [Ruminococcus sp. CAG:403]
MRRVVITGMAPICSLGSDHETVFENLCSKKQYKTRIDKNTPARKKIKAEWYVPFPDCYSDDLFQEKLAPVKASGAKSAYIAAKAALLAMQDAKLEQADDNTMVIVGTDSFSMEELVDQLIQFDTKQKMYSMMIPLTIQSAIASWVTIVLGTHGMSSVINMACASSTTSVGICYESILNGKCDMAVCGGTSYIGDRNLTMFKGFEYLKCSSTNKEGNVYPFSKEKNGFLFSEGAACMLVIEELEHALKRGAEIYAEITGFACSSDAYNVVSMYPNGTIVENMLKKLVQGKKVDYYNAHGTATILNDEVEAKIIQNVFGDADSQPAINSSKAFLGHTLGASGAIELAVCADSIRHNKVHGNLCGTILENLNYTPETREMQVDCAVSSSLGFGGHNSAIMVERYRK